MSGLVLLLPHGIEGQGPDHSNARLERFLQLAARENIQVGNLTTPAQYFHALRRQVKPGFRKPLVLMTPKSLLRHPKAVSPLSDLTEGGFRDVLDDTCAPADVERILLCSGKIYYDLVTQRETTNRRDAAIVRVEMLYPFPEGALGECLEKYRNAREFVWVQDEPRNYGAWIYMRDRFSTHFSQIELQYFGREENACGATASLTQYQGEQKQLVEGAFGLALEPDAVSD